MILRDVNVAGRRWLRVAWSRGRVGKPAIDTAEIVRRRWAMFGHRVNPIFIEGRRYQLPGSNP